MRFIRRSSAGAHSTAAYSSFDKKWLLVVFSSILALWTFFGGSLSGSGSGSTGSSRSASSFSERHHQDTSLRSPKENDDYTPEGADPFSRLKRWEGPKGEKRRSKNHRRGGEEAAEHEGESMTPNRKIGAEADSMVSKNNQYQDDGDGRSQLGIDRCASKHFVQWQDEEAGIIRLMNSEEGHDEQNIIGKGKFVCPPKQIKYRCCSRSSNPKWKKLGDLKALNNLQARELALEPFGEILGGNERAISLWWSDPKSKIQKERNKHSSEEQKYYQVAPHLADLLLGVKESDEEAVRGRQASEKEVQEPPALLSTPSSERCSCLVFSCVGASVCDDSITDKEECDLLGKNNVLVRYPRSNVAKSLSTVPSAWTRAQVRSTHFHEVDSDVEKLISSRSKKKSRRDKSGSEHQQEVAARANEKDHGEVASKGAPNILLFLIDSVSWKGFKSRFPRTQEFLEKMKQTGLPVAAGVDEDRAGNERVAIVEDTNSLGAQSSSNHPPLLLGKLPAKCAAFKQRKEGTPTKKDGDYFQRYQEMKKRVITQQSERNELLQSHILKVAKDHGYKLSAALYPMPYSAVEATCLGVDTEDDMLSGVPATIKVLDRDEIHHSDGGKKSIYNTVQSPVADIFQWSFFNEAVHMINRALNGSQGCIGAQHSMDYVDQFVDALFLNNNDNSAHDESVVEEKRGKDRHGDSQSKNFRLKRQQDLAEAKILEAKRHRGPVFAMIAEQTPHQQSWETGAIEYLDRRIALLLERLYTHGVLEDTVVVFTADHGRAYDKNKRSDVVQLLAEITHPVLWYLLPPSLSVLSSKEGGSKNAARQQYSKYLAKIGRRDISDSVRRQFRNILKNSNSGGGNMRVTHFDTYATMVDIISSTTTDRYITKTKGAGKLQNSEGVVDFARSMTVDYEQNPHSNWLGGKTTDGGRSPFSDPRGSRLSEEQILERTLRPSCTDMGVFLHSCRHYKDDDVLKIWGAGTSDHIKEIEGSLKKKLREALTTSITIFTGIAQTTGPCKYCTDWSKISLDNFGLQSIHKRTFEDGTFFFVIVFEVSIPQAKSGRSEDAGGTEDSPPHTSVRSIRFRAETKGKRDSSSASSSSITHTTTAKHLKDFPIGNIVRLSTYAEDEIACGIEVKAMIEKVKNGKSTLGAKHPLANWEGIEMQFCACRPLGRKKKIESEVQMLGG